MLVVGLELDGLPACVHHVHAHAFFVKASTPQPHAENRFAGSRHAGCSQIYPQKSAQKRDEKLLVANVGQSDAPVRVGYGVFCMDVLPICQFANRTLENTTQIPRLARREGS